jgi:hypothetical protein
MSLEMQVLSLSRYAGYGVPIGMYAIPVGMLQEGLVKSNGGAHP